ncbi:MAG TPA: RNA polymerase sigma factor [Tepidisphaeraceae bacterium]|nr:RNA polymerase sigma factor [Tepidisphaeraceae bacterium]
MDRAVEGDASALEELLLHFHDPMLAEIRRLMCGQDGAEDVLQEVMIETFRRIRTLEARGGEAFGAWLRAIARTRVINRAKAGRRLKRGGGMERDVAESVWERIVGWETAASVTARKKEAIEFIAREVGRLDENRRQAIRMRYGQGMSVEQIAIKMGKKPGAVKMLINRAIKELREAMGTGAGDFSRGV